MAKRKAARGRGKGKPTLEEELARLRALADEPDADRRREALREALGSRSSHVIARAATLVGEGEVSGLEEALLAAFERCREDPVERDPGCHAKSALLEALDILEAAPFELLIPAARYVQREPSWGPPVDTAAGVRARALYALARKGYEDLLLLCAERLSDPEAPVRLAAIESIAARGWREGAGLLLFKLELGDEDPVILSACMGALLALAPEWGRARLGRDLEGADELRRDLAAVALAESRDGESVALLIGWLDRAILGSHRRVAITALGLSRSEAALSRLLSIVREGHPRDAEAAVKALRPRRFDPRIVERAWESARARDDGLSLGPAIRSALESEEE